MKVSFWDVIINSAVYKLVVYGVLFLSTTFNFTLTGCFVAFCCVTPADPFTFTTSMQGGKADGLRIIADGLVYSDAVM